MNPATIIETLRKRGVEIAVEGDQLRIRASASTMIDESRHLLKTHKPELLIYLKLVSAITTAADWRGLEAGLDDAQSAYEAGLLTADAVERLATMAGQEALVLPEEVAEARLSQWLREQSVRRVYSRVLGEAVLFAAEDANIPAGNVLAVYRASELVELVGKSPAQLQSIHAAKKVFKGELRPSSRRISGDRDSRKEAALACK